MKILKGDYIIMSIAIIIALVLLTMQITQTIISDKNSQKQRTVFIFADNILYKTMDINKNTNTEININIDNDENFVNMTIKIQNGEVFVEHSNCHNKVCAATGKIKSVNQSIICLPNKIFIKIEESEKNISNGSEIDEIAG